MLRCASAQQNLTNGNQLFTLDPVLQDTVQRHIELRSDKYFSSFKTSIDVRYFSNGVLAQSMIQPDFQMISWYSSHGDTIDLVAHVGDLETQALLVRFIGGQPQVFYFRASHEGQKYYRLDKTDSFASKIEVPPARYKLGLSKIPDTLGKPVVFGVIDMQSTEYFDRRASGAKYSVGMRFYFRSQYRKF